jgi:hypothetical protein
MLRSIELQIFLPLNAVLLVEQQPDRVRTRQARKKKRRNSQGRRTSFLYCLSNEVLVLASQSLLKLRRTSFLVLRTKYVAAKPQAILRLNKNKKKKKKLFCCSLVSLLRSSLCCAAVLIANSWRSIRSSSIDYPEARALLSLPLIWSWLGIPGAAGGSQV